MLETEGITLNIRNTIMDQWHAMRVLYAHRPWRRISRAMTVLGLLMGVGGIVLGLYVSAVLLLICAVGVHFNLASLLQVFLSAKASQRRNETCEVTLDQTGIHVSSPSASGDFQWDFILEVIESDREFLLAFDRYNCFILPKRLTSGEAEIGSIRSLLKEHVSDYKMH